MISGPGGYAEVLIMSNYYVNYPVFSAASKVAATSVVDLIITSKQGVFVISDLIIFMQIDYCLKAWIWVT